MASELVKPGETDQDWAKGQLTQFKTKFDKVLIGFLDQKRAEAQAIRPELGEKIDICANFILDGGKRLRPAFVYIGWTSAGGDKDDTSILEAAIPMELVHAGALIHDDVMDNSDSRRGNPTVHKVLEKRTGSAETGESLAIVAGDTVLAMADEAMTAYPNFGGRYKEARECFDQMVKEINWGQIMDVEGNLMSQVSEDWIMDVMRYKTAGYTVEKPLLVGAILGGASTRMLQGLSDYGVNLGIAFQIKDDILGMFGDEKKVGKPVDSDLKEGKKTLLVARTNGVLTEQHRQAEFDRFNKILGDKNLTPEDYVWCQNLMKETGAMDHCQKLVVELTQKAQAAITDIGIIDEAKRFLIGISEFLVAREY